MYVPAGIAPTIPVPVPDVEYLVMGFFLKIFRAFSLLDVGLNITFEMFMSQFACRTAR
jgi:hypothetical protein